MYKNDEKWCPRLKGKIHWDPKLVERFIDVRPEFLIMRELLFWPQLDRDNNRRANSRRGHMPNSENFGYSKYDHDCYNIKWYQFWNKDPGVVDLDKLSECEKLVVAEAEGRMAYMDAVIRKYKESKIQIQVIEDKDPSNKVELKIGL